MSGILQDIRYAIRTLRRSARPDVRHRGVARDRHRRQHRDLQRRQRAAAQAAAVSRPRSPGGALAAVVRASTFRRTGRRPVSTSTSRTRTARSKRCRSRRAAAARCSAASGIRRSPASAARRSARHVVQPLLIARREAASTAGSSARRKTCQASAPVVILSHGFWTPAFNGDPNIVGKTITLNGLGRDAGEHEESVRSRRRARAGLPAERRDHADRREHPADGRVPAAPVRARTPSIARGDENFNVMARLKPGVTMAAGEERRRGHRRPDSREGQARSHVHDRRRAARRIRRRQRAPGGARRCWAR